MPAATPTPSPTPTATWLLEPLFLDAEGVGDETAAAVLVGEEEVRLEELDEGEIVELMMDVAEGVAVRWVTTVATPRLKTRDDVEQQSDLSRSQQQKSPSPHGCTPLPVMPAKSYVSLPT